MYSFFHLMHDVQRFYDMGCETGRIGTTELGQNIPYVFVGNKKGARVLVVGATHAREHITSLLVARQIYHYKKNNVRLEGGIYFVPMLNIDGVRLCQEGVSFLTDKSRQDFLIEVNGGSHDFSLWKANANAVDINVNFDACWSTGKSNVNFPSPANYIGKKPMSEKETVAIANFAKNVKADYVITYHAKGEEIYWQFFQQGFEKWRDYRYAKFVSRHTGYRLVSQTQSAGGFKDWCVQKLGIPAITVEVGNDKFSHPYPYHQIDDITTKNLLVPQKMLNTIYKEKTK